MNILRSGGRLALLFIVLALLVSGCVPRGGVVDAGWTVVTVEGTRVYAVRSTGEAVALDATQGGELIWRYPLQGAAAAPGCGILQQGGDAAAETEVALGAVYGAPVVAGDLVLVGSSEGRLIALDAESGALAWTFAGERAIIGGIAVADGVAYFGSVDGQVYAVDLDTQQVVWDTPFLTGDRVWSTPVVDDTHVYVASMDHSVYAIDRASGLEVWSTDLGGAIQGDIALEDQTVLAGGVDRRLYALDANTGDQIWATEQLDAWVWGKPLVANERVYFTTLNGRVHGRAFADGEVLWQPITLEGGISAGPTQVDGAVAVATDAGRVYLIDVDAGRAEVLYGALAEQQHGGFMSAPVAQDGTLYLGGRSGSIVALDPMERNPALWVYPSATE